MTEAAPELVDHPAPAATVLPARLVPAPAAGLAAAVVAQALAKSEPAVMAQAVATPAAAEAPVRPGRAARVKRPARWAAVEMLERRREWADKPGVPRDAVGKRAAAVEPAWAASRGVAVKRVVARRAEADAGARRAEPAAALAPRAARDRSGASAAAKRRR